MPTAVFASGEGTNLQAVIDAVAADQLPLDLNLVLSDKPGAYALQRAARSGIPAQCYEFRPAIETRASYAVRLAAAVRASGARLVLLLGWMRVLAPEFIDAGFLGVLNLHPAYLPEDPAADVVTLPDGTRCRAFRGPHALRDAIAAGAGMVGATLIQITPEVDRGPVLARKQCPLLPGDDETAALQRLHSVEREVVREGIWAWLTQRGIDG
ncbi:MAG: phosphoribosylglycinamide formyltransferase [Candidatus Eremiobacteraeota bacterium]|nr:phosphoribosylglycinamide formyltransferase [Candidatus Eremiobacteraeota bacterium]